MSGIGGIPDTRHSAPVAAFGKSGQFQTGQFSEIQWLLSATTGHSLTVNDDPLDHRMTSMPVRLLLVGVADAAKQCLIEVLADELDAIGQTVFRESAG